MKQRHLLPCALALCLAAFALPVLAQTAEEPSYRGRPLDSYVAQLASPEARQRLLAAQAISRMGPGAKAAVPPLVALLEKDDDISVRVAAVIALAKIGPEAKTALPALRRAAAGGDERLSRAAASAVEAIEPSLATRLKELTSTTTFIVWASVGGVALVAIAGVALVWRRRGEPERAPRAGGAAPAKPKEATPAKAAASAGEPAAAGATSRPAADRRRVSRALPGFDEFGGQAEEGPESIKKSLVRAQEELKAVADRQVEIGRQLGHKEIAGDPDRLLSLRREDDKLAPEHYWQEVRVKALEVKLLDKLMGGSKTTDEALKERSESTLRQKWAELRELCERPVKIRWEGEQWSRSPAGEPRSIEDLRAHVAEYGVSLPEEPKAAPSLATEDAEDAPESTETAASAESAQE